MKTNPNLVFLLAARRTGGTALAKAFKDQGFRLVYDPLNPYLSNLNEAMDFNSEAWHSKHPIGLRYFEEFVNTDASVRPKDLVRANTQHIGRGDPQYEEISNYFHHLVNATSEGIKTCFKIEQVGVYELLRSEFPEATFIGITRNPEEILASYLNLYLTSSNFHFFQTDLDYFLANGDAEAGRDYLSLPERCIEAVKYVSQTHSALVRNFCQIQISIHSKSASVETEAGFDPDEVILKIVNGFMQQVPAVKFGFESELILKSVGSLAAERDALVSERDALVLSRSWRIIAFLRRALGFR